jgi:hypothetical protein
LKSDIKVQNAMDRKIERSVNKIHLWFSPSFVRDRDFVRIHARVCSLIPESLSPSVSVVHVVSAPRCSSDLHPKNIFRVLHSQVCFAQKESTENERVFGGRSKWGRAVDGIDDHQEGREGK